MRFVPSYKLVLTILGFALFPLDSYAKDEDNVALSWNGFLDTYYSFNFNRPSQPIPGTAMPASTNSLRYYDAYHNQQQPDAPSGANAYDFAHAAGEGPISLKQRFEYSIRQRSRDEVCERHGPPGDETDCGKDPALYVMWSLALQDGHGAAVCDRKDEG